MTGGAGNGGQNESERLFELCLRAAGFGDFAHEPDLPGTTRRPDYMVTLGEQQLLFEVKEFRATAKDAALSGGCFDPYPPLREKINAAAKKFKDLDGYCCNLVLYNQEKPLVFLDWEHIYGAMLGNLGFQVPVSLTGEPVPPEAQVARVFTSGGKMHHEADGKPVAPKNQTISSVIVVQHLAVGQERFGSHCRQVERSSGRKLGDDEFLRLLDDAKGTPHDPEIRQLRVVVHENPYARIPIPEAVFLGPWDERYGGRDGQIQRVFAGEEVLGLEAFAS